MIGKKQEIETFLVFQPDDRLFFIDEVESKESKTRQQEKGYYLLMNGIAKHLGYSVYEVKMYFLSGCFGTHRLKLSKTEIEIANKSKTSELTKDEAIFFIDTIQTFCKIHNIPVKIESNELNNLYNSYN